MKIKQFYALSLIFFFILSVSCSSNPDITDTDTVKPEKEKVSIWVGEEVSIKVASNIETLSVSSDDEEIATAYIEDNVVVISAKEQSGSTAIRISYGSTEKAKISVSVVSLSGGWEETEFSPFVYEVIIESEEASELIVALKQEILEDALKKMGTIYTFYESNNRLEVIDIDKEHYSGEYIYENKKLILEYNTIIEEYYVTFYAMNFLQLTQDLTNDYKDKYPNAGITSVQVFKYLVYITY